MVAIRSHPASCHKDNKKTSMRKPLVLLNDQQGKKNALLQIQELHNCISGSSSLNQWFPTCFTIFFGKRFFFSLHWLYFCFQNVGLVSSEMLSNLSLPPCISRGQWRLEILTNPLDENLSPDSDPAENHWLKKNKTSLPLHVRKRRTATPSASTRASTWTEVKLCWTGRRRASPLCNSRPATSLRRTGRRSSVRLPRRAATTPSSCRRWPGHSGPPRRPQWSCRWRPARPARLARWSGGCSQPAAGSRRWTREWRGLRPGCCSPRWRRGSASWRRRPGSTLHWSLCPSDKLEGRIFGFI